MAVRQYIGARYVTKIYENSLDPASAEWEASTNYEPLVLVTYNNGSYLSKKEVPATVGEPPTNGEYWVQTGFYNGQIASLQAQIDTLNNTTIPGLSDDIDDLESVVDDIAYTKLNGKRVVIITDSYGEIANNFITHMLSLCPELVTNDNFFPFAYGGAGFVGGGAGYDWETKFVTSGDINTVTDPNTITDIFVLGGSNDRSASISMSDIKTNARSFYTAITSVFTNARVYVGYIGYSTNYLAQNYAPQVKQAYQECGFYGYRPIAHANSWLHYTGYISDNVHPTSNGSLLIAVGVLNVLIGGGTDDISVNREISLVVTMETGYTSVNLPVRLRSCHWGHRSRIDLGDYSSFSFDSGNFTFDGSWHKFASFTDSFLYGAADNKIIVVGMMNLAYNGDSYTVPITIKVFNHGLYYMLFPHTPLTGTISAVYVTVNMPAFEMDDIYM